MKDFKVNIGGAWKDTDKMYCKIDGVWKTVEGVWTKIAGAWVECKGLPELSYYGLAGNLKTAMEYLSGETIGDYAIFTAGGVGGSTRYNDVNVYSSTLTRTNPTTLSTTRNRGGSVSAGNYAFFGGGRLGNGSRTTALDAFNSSVVRTTATAFNVEVEGPATGAIGDNVLFAGGMRTNDTYSQFIMTYSSTNLTRLTARYLEQGLMGVCGASGTDYVIFAGGLGGGGSGGSGTSTNIVEAFNSSLVKTTPVTLLSAKLNMSGGFTGTHYVCIGGSTTYTGGSLNVVEIFDTNLVRVSTSITTTPRSNAVSVDIGGAVFFAGGNNGTSATDGIDLFDNQLTRISATLPTKRYRAAGALLGDKILVGGGAVISSSFLDTVLVYQYK